MRDSKQNKWYKFFIPILAFLFTINSNAQTLLQPQPVQGFTNKYLFTVTDLGSQDLVVFRFSDGYHINKIVEVEATSVSVERQFKEAIEYSVNAYIAKKGGTLGITTNIQTVTPSGLCDNCESPQLGMASNQNLLLSTSWNSFFLDAIGGELESFQDVVVDMITPTDEAWFFLNLTLQNTSSQLTDNLLKLSFPNEVYEVDGVIINNEWIDFDNFSATSENYYPNEIDLVSTITYEPDGKVNFTFDREIEGQENIYLVVTGEPSDLDEEFIFKGQIFSKKKKKGSYLIEEVNLTVKPTNQPHDPNDISTAAPNKNFPYNETMGWIRFDLSHNDCYNDTTVPWVITSGEIVFIPIAGINQYTPMNFLFHKKCYPMLCINSILDNEVKLISTSSEKRTADQNFETFEIAGYPTITQDQFFISTSLLKKGKSLNMIIVDLHGKIWQEKNIKIEENMKWEESIDVSNLPSGIYFLKSEYNQNVNHLKIIKQ